MADKITKCPICSTKLKMIDGRMTCKSCGYYVRTQAPTNEKRPANTPNTSISIAVMASVCFVLLAGVGIVAAIQLSGSIGSGDNSVSNFGNHPTWEDQAISSAPSPILDSAFTEEQPQGEQRLPQSGFFQDLAQMIWGKNYSAISSDEYSSLISLEIDKTSKSIYYELADGTSDTLTFANTTHMDLADLTCFTNLEWIYIPGESLHRGDLDGIYNLHGVVTRNTISEYRNIIPDPNTIHELSIMDDGYSTALIDIESFPNLEYLIVDSSALVDISALTKLPSLWGLELNGCDALTDYSPLMSLTGLESLSINSPLLDSIDFVQYMPNLTSLTIEWSSIENIDALSDCPNLTHLSLINNANVTDYSAVGELTGLEKLNLSYYWTGADLPSFTKMNRLQELTLAFANDLTPLKDAVNVTHLTLNKCSDWQLEVLTAMQNLEYLEFHGYSNIVESMESLTRLPNLKYLDLSNSWIYGNIEEVFFIPTLRYLNLNDCYVGIDFNNLNDVNTSLEILSMERLTIWDDPFYYDKPVTELRDHVDMFALFPNLTDLYVTSAGLADITFVESMPYLQYLDITDNNVTSLKPLEALDHFITVWCGENDILENVSEDSGIQVITTEHN